MKSTNANLKFLEAQLGEYLHSHETDDVAKKLWVTDRGFRLPYRRERWSLHNNMKFVERQLEEYLHEHEVVVANEPCNTARQTGEVLRDTDMASVFRHEDVTYGSPIHSSDWYDDGPWRSRNFGASELVVSTTNPNSGTNHFRYDGSNSTGARVIAPVMLFSELCSTVPTTVSGDAQPFSARVREGDSVTFSYQATADSPLNLRSTISTYGLDGSSVLPATVNGTTVTVGGTYEEVTASFTVQEEGYIIAFVDLVGRPFGEPLQDVIADFDTPSLTVTGDAPDQTTLYTNHTGFRFPYQDYDAPGSLEGNMKFLETQVSKYLHKHEEGT